MLMHVDRLPTHIISAILQVHNLFLLPEIIFFGLKKKIILILYVDI